MTRFSQFLAAAAVAGGLAFTAPVTASAAGFGGLAGLEKAAPQSDVVQVHRRGRGIALGILGAAAATAIIAGAARAHRYDDGYYYGGSYRPRWSCWDLREACDDGSRWACRRYYNRCD